MSSSCQWGCCELTPSAVTLRCQSGNHTVCVHLFGATVTSWNHGEIGEQLFLSSKSKFNKVKAIRGGIPVVFPQFGRPSEAMSQHGFARTSMWTIGEIVSSDSSCSVQLLLSSSEATLAQWPYAFQLKYTVTLSDVGLKCVLTVMNTGNSSFECHTLLHTYFRVPHISRVRIVGFNGHEYTDKVQDGAVNTTTEESIAITSEVDRVYLSPSSLSPSSLSSSSSKLPIPDIHITDAQSGQALMRVEKCACLTQPTEKKKKQEEKEKEEEEEEGEQNEGVDTDCVLWNQWQAGSEAMGDMDDDGFEHYVCVEPGTVSEYVTVPPLATLSLTQRLVPMPESA